VFVGDFQHTLDDKGRVILPARFRERLAGGLVLTRGFDRCVEVWTQAAYERRLEDLRARPRENRGARVQMRMFTSGASDQVPDSQGRIVLPARLREYAGLQRELSVIGTDDHVEIWDRTAWDAYLAANEDEFAGMADVGNGS
jgi:MraZ protein